MALSVPLRGSRRESAVAQLFSLGIAAMVIDFMSIITQRLYRFAHPSGQRSSIDIFPTSLDHRAEVRQSFLDSTTLRTRSSIFRLLELSVFRFSFLLDFISLMPNKSPEPTAVGAGRSAIAVRVAGRRWLSFLR